MWFPNFLLAHTLVNFALVVSPRIRLWHEMWWKFVGEKKCPRWKLECLLNLLLANSCKKTFSCLCKHYLKCKPHIWKEHCQFVDEKSWMWTKEICVIIFIPHGSWPYEQWMQRCHMLNHVPMYTIWTYCRRWTPIGSRSCLNKHQGRLVIKDGRTLHKFKVLWSFLQKMNENFKNKVKP
jgi:hypothetical protein